MRSRREVAPAVFLWCYACHTLRMGAIIRCMSDHSHKPRLPNEIIPLQRCPGCRCVIGPECYPQPWPVGPSPDPTKILEVVYVCGLCWERGEDDPDFADRISSVVMRWREMNR